VKLEVTFAARSDDHLLLDLSNTAIVCSNPSGIYLRFLYPALEETDRPSMETYQVCKAEVLKLWGSFPRLRYWSFEGGRVVYMKDIFILNKTWKEDKI
jgi:hypothetical protein